jgi:spermidine/putrescine-binding protein
MGRRRWKGLLGGVLAVLLLSGGVRAEEKIEGPLIVDSFGGAYAEAVKQYIVEPFEKAYGIEVKLNHFGSNSEQLAKLKAGKTDMDVTFLGNGYTYMAGKEGLLLPLRMENIPNYAELYDMFQKPLYDPGPEQYCVSFIWGDQAIAWNKEKADRPTSWGALWNPAYKGRVAMFGSPTSAIPVTAIYLGQDPNSISDMEAIQQKLRELRPNLLKFWKSGAELTQLLATEEVWIADFWRGRVKKLQEEGHPIGYTQPEEGSFVWIDCLAIPKDAQHRRAAEAFLNFAVSAKPLQDFVTKGVNYAPASKAVELTEDQREMLGATDEIIERALLADPAYVMKHRDEWNRIMNEIMAGD